MCRKRKHQKPIELFKRRTFEFVIDHFKVECERCHQPLVIHGYRQKNPHKGQKELIYAACQNKDQVCPKYGREICFIERYF